MIQNPITAQTRLAQAQAREAYTDLNSLQHLKQLGGENRELAMRQLARQFESMFLHMVMKSMRSANEVFEQDNPLNSSALKLHRDMLDSQLALDAGKGSRLGLADALYRQLTQTYQADAGATADALVQDNFRQAPPPPPAVLPAATETAGRRVTLGDKQAIVEDPRSFVERLYPHAQKAAAKLGLDIGVLIAQAALETGWGQHVIHDGKGRSSHNLFNIKADTRWQGDAVRVPTVEYRQGIAARETAEFRQYSGLRDSFADYVSFLSDNSRYRRALQVTADPGEFVQALQEAGYATDPKYADKVLSILDGPHLKRAAAKP